MRTLALLFVLLFVSSAWAQSQEIKKPVSPITDKTKGTNKPKDGTDKKQTITVELPPTINIAVGGKLEVKSDNENAKRNEEGAHWAEWLVALFTGLLVGVTGFLARYTYLLWNSTADASTRQAGEMRDSLRIAQESADATTQAAEAAYIASIPILAPHVIDTVGLHRDIGIYHDNTPFASTVKLVFNNYGKTPGIVREVRADLILTDNDVLPQQIAFDQLPLKHHEIMIPGDTIWGLKPPLPGHLVEPTVARSFTFSEEELGEIAAEAATGKYKRFYLVGRIIYDDFFRLSPHS